MTATLPEERHALAFKESIGAVAEAVPISLYCRDAGVELRRSGAQLVGRCPLEDHEDRTPSWTVFGDRRYWCFGCHRGGDVVDLHAELDGHAEVWSAMVDLSVRYGVRMPRRSERWKAAEGRKLSYHELRARALAPILAKRLFGAMVVPVLDLIEDDAERNAAVEEAWAEWTRDAGFWRANAAELLRGPEERAKMLAVYGSEVAAARELVGAKPGGGSP